MSVSYFWNKVFLFLWLTKLHSRSVAQYSVSCRIQLPVTFEHQQLCYPFQHWRNLEESSIQKWSDPATTGLCFGVIFFPGGKKSSMFSNCNFVYIYFFCQDAGELASFYWKNKNFHKTPVDLQTVHKFIDSWQPCCACCTVIYLPSSHLLCWGMRQQVKSSLRKLSSVCK